MSTQNYDIKETLDYVEFVAEVVKARAKAMEDGKHSWYESTLYIPAALKLPKAISGTKDIPKELLDLDQAEQERLLDAAFDIIDFKTEKVRELTRKCIDSGLTFYRDTRNLTQEIIAQRRA